MTTTGGTTTVAYTRDALDRITERKVTGTKIGTTATFDPNGNQTSGTTADNATGNFDNRWLGRHQRPTETEPGLEPIIEMGARQYSPRLGRFLETDPVTGGSANAYAYTFGDPNNTNDITGRCPDCGLLALVSAYYANQSQDPLDYVRPLDHTWQMLAIFPLPQGSGSNRRSLLDPILTWIAPTAQKIWDWYHRDTPGNSYMIGLCIQQAWEVGVYAAESTDGGGPIGIAAGIGGGAIGCAVGTIHALAGSEPFNRR